MKTITYRFEVTATLPLADDPENVDYYTEAQAVSVEHRASVNRALFALLQRSHLHDCDDWDCEMLDFTIEDDGLHGPECSCPTCGSERARDAEEERRS